MNRCGFGLSWFALTLVGLAVVNLAFAIFVVSLDVLVGAPPQVSAPLFVLAVILVIAFGALLTKQTRRRSKTPSFADQSAPSFVNDSSTRSRESGFRSILIIRRDLDTRPGSVANERGIYETSI
jgi:hypothetical protein